MMDIVERLCGAYSTVFERSLAREAADTIQQQAERIRELEREAENYRSVMIAAAEEIHEYWDAHCDEEGYGPANLMYRLENGIPAEYGYKVGTFNQMQSRIDGIEQQLAEVVEYAGKLRDAVVYSQMYSGARVNLDALPLPKALRAEVPSGTAMQEKA